jgi:hypothetical protein
VCVYVYKFICRIICFLCLKILRRLRKMNYVHILERYLPSNVFKTLVPNPEGLGVRGHYFSRGQTLGVNIYWYMFFFFENRTNNFSGLCYLRSTCIVIVPFRHNFSRKQKHKKFSLITNQRNNYLD